MTVLLTERFHIVSTGMQIQRLLIVPDLVEQKLAWIFFRNVEVILHEPWLGFSVSDQLQQCLLKLGLFAWLSVGHSNNIQFVHHLYS
ncbi:hypothetical protein D3C79_957620 [compost metagenome]